MIRIPHILNYRLQNRNRALTKSTKTKLLRDNPTSLVNTFKDYGVTAVNVTLNEKTLSDDFRFDIASRSVEINETVQGYLLDYPFHFLVEETNQTDLVQSVKGRYSIDDLLYTWFYLSLDTEEFPKAAEIITRIAHYFLLVPVVKIDDFTPSNFTNNTMMTYADVLSSLFGWTSRLPQRQVNTFIRGNVLYCIQRGKEDSVFDITDLPHSRPTINKKFNRVLCYNPNKDGSDDDGDENDNMKLFSGTIGYTDSNFTLSYTYNQGLLQKEYIRTMTGNGLTASGIPYSYGDGGWTATDAQSSTTYDYISYGSINKSEKSTTEYEYYLSAKNIKSTTIQTTHSDNESETIKVITNTYTTYHYKMINTEIYLFAEYETTNTKEYEYNEQSWEKTTDETHNKQTHHTPAGNGWYSQVVYLDGEPQGANLSQGAPSNRISLYTVNQMQSHFCSEYVYAPTVNPSNNELSAIVDDSFPVKESAIKTVLNEALRWLHRKTIETVTVDLISAVVDGVPSINHIVDFTERVKLNGAEYFLVSNTISFTPRKLIQKLQLIRWY